MEQTNIFDWIEDKWQPSWNIDNYKVRKVNCETAKEYIHKNHYSKGSHNAPFPCYALYDGEMMIGCLMFATPCSENVRASIFGEKYKDNVIELHRLHILDVTPRNTESWFISRCVKLLLEDRPQTWAIISFSDKTEGHEGTIYKASNFMFLGTTSKATFFMDEDGRLHHPRQCGINISLEEAERKKWQPVKRESKNRYLLIVGKTKKEKKEHLKMFLERFKNK